MFHLPFLLPAAALLHIGQWAISRTLDLAHCPICWVPTTHPPPQNKNTPPFLNQKNIFFIKIMYNSMYQKNITP